MKINLDTGKIKMCWLPMKYRKNEEEEKTLKLSTGALN